MSTFFSKIFQPLLQSPVNITGKKITSDESNLHQPPPSDVPKDFYGKYKLATSENFEEFLREIGVGLMKRKLATTSYPTVEFAKDENDNFVFKSHTIIKSSETKFRLGEEFDEDRLDGKRVKSTVVVDGNKLVQTQKDGNMEIKYIREFTDNEIRVTSIANEVKCLRVYKKVPE